MNWNSIASNSLIMQCIAYCAVRKQMYRKRFYRKSPNLGDGQDGCVVDALIGSWSYAR